MKNHASVTGWQSCFSHSNAPNSYPEILWVNTVKAGQAVSNMNSKI